MRPTPRMFRCILALALGKSLAEIDRLDSKEYAEWRRFYLLCPFGPARLDINAWLTAQHVWSGWNGRTKPLEQSLLWFGKPMRKRKAKPKPNNAGRAWVESLKARGGAVQTNVENLNRGTQRQADGIGRPV